MNLNDVPRHPDDPDFMDLAFFTGMMTGITAIEHYAKDGEPRKKGAELLAMAIVKNSDKFVEGIAETCLIVMKEQNEFAGNITFLEKFKRYHVKYGKETPK